MEYLVGKVDTICLLPLSLNIPFVTAMVPNIAKTMAINDKVKLNQKIVTFLKITILISIPSTIGILIYAEPILNLLFPNANNGTLLLKINSISIFFACLSQTINGILQGIGKIKLPVIALSIGMICKFICNVVLINIECIGIKGAAIGNIACNLIACIIGGIALFKSVNVKINYKSAIIKMSIAISMMIIFAIFIYNSLKRIFLDKVAIIISILIVAILYLVIIVFLNLIPNFEKNFHKKGGFYRRLANKFK